MPEIWSNAQYVKRPFTPHSTWTDCNTSRNAGIWFASHALESTSISNSSIWEDTQNALCPIVTTQFLNIRLKPCSAINTNPCRTKLWEKCTISFNALNASLNMILCLEIQTMLPKKTIMESKLDPNMLFCTPRTDSYALKLIVRHSNVNSAKQRHTT